jgi:hypothetical protein
MQSEPDETVVAAGHCQSLAQIVADVLPVAVDVDGAVHHGPTSRAVATMLLAGGVAEDAAHPNQRPGDSALIALLRHNTTSSNPVTAGSLRIVEPHQTWL